MLQGGETQQIKRIQLVRNDNLELYHEACPDGAPRFQSRHVLCIRALHSINADEDQYCYYGIVYDSKGCAKLKSTLHGISAFAKGGFL